MTRLGSDRDNGPERRPFDFADEFYLANGIDPARIVSRVTADLDGCCADLSLDPRHAPTRILRTAGGYDASGKELYYVVTGMATGDTFTPGAAGRRALMRANSSRTFVFPKKNRTLSSASLADRRQDDVLEAAAGSTAVNPLGLSTLTFVRWNDAVADRWLFQLIADMLAENNDLDLDGTPQIHRADEAQELAGLGYLRLWERPEDGSQGPRWLIRPTLADPRRGAIAPDAQLAVVETAPGIPQNPSLVDDFECLRTTGDFCP